MFKEYYIDVIVPIALEGTFTYHIDEQFFEQIKIGARVVVKFNKTKTYTAIVTKIHSEKPSKYKTSPIIDLIDEKPIITENQLKVWKWIANYYCCSLGEVFKNAVPSALKLEGETVVSKKQNLEEIDLKSLSDDEYLICEALETSTSLNVEEISKILDKKATIGLLKTLHAKGIIELEEEILNRYKPKMKSYVRFAKKFSEKELKIGIESLNRAKKQKQIFIEFIALSKTKNKISKKELLETSNANATALKELEKKGALVVYKEQIDRLIPKNTPIKDIPKLSEIQEKAYFKLIENFKTLRTSLLYGVTSSGKTEVYAHLIQSHLEKQEQVLYLLPEIALTTQLINRLRVYFGDKIGVYHSRFTKNERVEIWNKTLSGEYKILIGARSTVFLPFQNLGLVIVDEEHESSFKQQNPNPKYNARDTAIAIAHLMDAKCVLGSATPSLESIYNVKNKKYGFAKLDKRFGNVLMPNIQIIDVKKEQYRKTMQGNFSSVLIKAIEEALENKKQIILFQNRRGYAPVLECKSCGNSPQCENCDVSLTFHAYKKQLRCHYCSYSISLPKRCNSCNSEKLSTKGAGTEQIEFEVQSYFPNARISRMDLDTTRQKNAYYNILSDFESGEVDILIGTQMITKGLHFDNVSLVGVINADQQLNFPSFRAHEKAFQLMSQVAGRAGRTKEQGLVLIQSNRPEHRILQEVSTHSFFDMVKEQLYERRQYNYPPYFRMIKLTLRHRQKHIVEDAAIQLVKALYTGFRNDVLGPEEPSINRIRNLYIQEINIKLNNKKPIDSQKKYIRKWIENLQSISKFKSIRIDYDVDPIG